MLRAGLMFLVSFVCGAVLACTADSSGDDGNLWQPCVNGICPLGYACVANYCLPTNASGETTGDGDGDSDDGDGDGDGDSGDGDGGPGDGDGGPGDGDGTPGDGDGEPCEVGTEGCPCDAGVCGPGLVCNMDDLCVEGGCGDGQISGDEDCDGNNLDGYTCMLLGFFGGGVLTCDDVTCMFDTSGCSDNPCGNGIVDIGEQCDGANLNGFDCQDLGYFGGTLACDPITCTYDASACTNW